MPGCAPPTAGSTTSSRWSTSTPTSPTIRMPTGSIDDVLVYDAASLRDGGPHRRRAGGRRGRAGAGAHRRPGHRRARPGRLRRPDRGRPGDGCFDAMIADRARRRGDRRRPLRQARRQRPGLERAGEARRARPRHVRRLLRQRHPRAGLARLARPRLPGHLAGQRRPPGRPARRTRTATTTSASSPTRSSSEYPTHVHLLSPVLTLQGAVAHSDMPVESGPTMYLPYSHQYDARLPRLAAAGVPRLLRRALRPAAAGQGRRGVLQPGAVPRRRHQRLAPTSSASRTCSRSPRRSAARWRPSTACKSPGRSTRRWSPARPQASTATLRSTTPSRRPPRATRSRPTSTATSPSDGLTPPSQAEVVRQALAEDWLAEALGEAFAAYDERRRTDDI